MTNYTIHSGNPIYTGRPHSSTIDLIYLLTTPPDSKGRQYYRVNPTANWQRLSTQSDYDALNRAVNYHLMRHGAQNQEI